MENLVYIVEDLERFELKGGQIDVVAYNTLVKGFRNLLRKQKAARGRVEDALKIMELIEESTSSSFGHITALTTEVSETCTGGWLRRDFRQRSGGMSGTADALLNFGFHGILNSRNLGDVSSIGSARSGEG
ncbi:hypothetical protein Tco_0712732 [Tanacetum coccineum]